MRPVALYRCPKLRPQNLFFMISLLYGMSGEYMLKILRRIQCIIDNQKNKAVMKRYRQEKIREYNRLIRNKKILSPPPPKRVGVERLHGIEEYIIWEIDTSIKTYMKLEARSDIYIIYIDAQKFYLNWLKSSIKGSDSRFSCPLLKDMPHDRKYHDAVKGFSHGKTNPVPLALPDTKEHGLISFTDGITRTLYLLYNQAPSFPVASYEEENAQFLNKYFGLTKAPLTTKDLLSM